MIDWRALSRRLGALARGARPGSVLALTVPLPRLPDGLPAAGEWVLWQRPEQGLSLLGIGAAVRVETGGAGRFAALDAAMRGLAGRWITDAAGVSPRLSFAGFAFAPDGGAPLPNAMLTVPAVLLRQTGGRADATFCCAAEDAADAVTRWRSSLAFSKPGRGDTPRLARRPAPLADLAFLARGAAALSAIDAGRFAKLVLTRSVRLVADRALDPAPALAALAAHNPGCAVWALARRGTVFLGASPERLLGLRDGRAEVDALAGTAWAEPASLPLSGDKNRREHELVVASVREALAALCDEVTVPGEPEIMRLNDLSHLRRRIAGRVRAGVGAFELIARLHPTPAVGGTPTAAAPEWLAAHRDLRGAWYTGGIGWLDADGNADFAVALRCGLIAGHEATLYAGAGFVAGSDPRQELAETEAKLAPMLSALRTPASGERMTGS